MGVFGRHGTFVGRARGRLKEAHYKNLPPRASYGKCIFETLGFKNKLTPIANAFKKTDAPARQRQFKDDSTANQGGDPACKGSSTPASFWPGAAGAPTPGAPCSTARKFWWPLW